MPSQTTTARTVTSSRTKCLLPTGTSKLDRGAEDLAVYGCRPQPSTSKLTWTALCPPSGATTELLSYQLRRRASPQAREADTYVISASAGRADEGVAQRVGEGAVAVTGKPRARQRRKPPCPTAAYFNRTTRFSRTELPASSVSLTRIGARTFLPLSSALKILRLSLRLAGLSRRAFENPQSCLTWRPSL
jgi:hypothetical protein